MAYDTIDYKEILKEAFPKGSTAYVTLRSVSRSGMSRRISIFETSVRSGDGGIYNKSYACAEFIGWPHGTRNDHASVRVSGCGMDMGFHLVYTLSSMLYDGDGYAIKHRWI